MKPLKYRDIIKKARKAGFVYRRNTGGTQFSHHHEIMVGTVKSIIGQMGMSEKEFLRL